MQVPYTPFSTRLSGSAREVELRLKNIFSGPKKRPPVLVMAVTAALILLCGNLVSFRAVDTAPLPDSSASVSVPLDTSASLFSLLSLPKPGIPVELHSLIVPSVSNFPYEYLTETETARLKNIPAAELPKEAVNLYPGPYRTDFWEDMLLPVAYDAAYDVTAYFVFGGMPAGTYRDINLNLFGAPNLKPDGIVLRWGDRTEYFPFTWYTNIKHSANPPLLVDDLDGDGQPEAALSLAWGDGTGCYRECLYLFDLDTMTCTVPDYSHIPLDITLSPNGNSAFLSSGSQEWTVDLSRLGVPFLGRVDVGNQIRFTLQNGKILCHLALDFGCNTLGYLASAAFPVVYEDGSYRLGPAERLSDSL